MTKTPWWKKSWRWFAATTPLTWLDAHSAEVSVGRSPGGEHHRVYDHVTKLPHYGHTLLQAAASAQQAREHHK